jgi:hypothetical protein
MQIPNFCTMIVPINMLKEDLPEKLKQKVAGRFVPIMKQ